MSIAVNYSPWYWSNDYWHSSAGHGHYDPTVRVVNGTDLEQAEREFLGSNLQKLKNVLAEVNQEQAMDPALEVGIIIHDEERFWFGMGIKPVGNDSAAWRRGVDRKAEIIYNTTRSVFPEANMVSVEAWKPCYFCT